MGLLRSCIHGRHIVHPIAAARGPAPHWLECGVASLVGFDASQRRKKYRGLTISSHQVRWLRHWPNAPTAVSEGRSALGLAPSGILPSEDVLAGAWRVTDFFNAEGRTSFVGNGIGKSRGGRCHSQRRETNAVV